MKFCNQLPIRDVFMNPYLDDLFPQFDSSGEALAVSVYSEIERYVSDYLLKVLGGMRKGERELQVQGKHKAVLQRVRSLSGVIEELFSHLPLLSKHLHRNSRLYTPYVSWEQLDGVNGADRRLEAFSLVLDNFKYNPDFGAESDGSAGYYKRQEKWMKKVDYKGVNRWKR